MNISLNAFIEDHGPAGWIGWIEGVKGMIVQADNEDEVRKELIVSLKTTIAYSLGLRDLKSISTEKIAKDMAVVCVEEPEVKTKFSRSINLSIA